MNSKTKQKLYSTQKHLAKDQRTHSIYASNPFMNIPIQPCSKANQFPLKIGSNKYHPNTKLCRKGFSGRQYSSSYLNVTPKPSSQTSKAMIDIKDHSRDKSIELLEQKYIEALNQVKHIKSSNRPQKYESKVIKNTYVSRSPINNHIKMNTELLKKKTQQFIDKRIQNKSPLRPSTPDYNKPSGNKENLEQRRNQKTPDSHSKRMSYYMITNTNMPSKSPSRNTKSKGNNTQLYQHTNTNTTTRNHLITHTDKDTVSQYQYIPSQTKANNTNRNHSKHNDITTTNTMRKTKKCAINNLTMNNSSSQKAITKPKPNSSAIHPDIIGNEKSSSNQARINSKAEQDLANNNQLLYQNIIQQTNNEKQIKRDLIRLSKPNTMKESQSKKTIQSTFVLPDEEQIDFNELDQFSPPYVGSINFKGDMKDKIFSAAGSTIYTTIEIANQDKQNRETIAASSLPFSNSRKIIDNFIYKMNSGNQKYSTLEYNHLSTLNDFKRTKETD